MPDILNYAVVGTNTLHVGQVQGFSTASLRNFIKILISELA